MSAFPTRDLLHIVTNIAAQYHDDGELGLGPTLASLSLGCPATMTFRPKTKASMPQESRWVKGTGMDRLNFPGVSSMADGLAPILEISLLHGDMVVMSGAQIQQLYEASTVSIPAAI